jgi:hypothetical protein
MMMRMMITIVLVVLLGACGTASGAAPLRGIWLKDLLTTDPPTTSSNPASKWWTSHGGSTAPATSHHAGDKPPECMWHDFPQHDSLKAWEFQGQPHRHMVSTQQVSVG